jgi:hypothetical protein
VSPTISTLSSVGVTELTDRCRSCVRFGSAQAKRLVNNLLRDAAK